MNEAKSAEQMDGMLSYTGRKIAELVEELGEVFPQNIGVKFGEAIDRKYGDMAGYGDGAVDGVADGIMFEKKIRNVRATLEQAMQDVDVASYTLQSLLHHASAKRGPASQSLVL